MLQRGHAAKRGCRETAGCAPSAHACRTRSPFDQPAKRPKIQNTNLLNSPKFRMFSLNLTPYQEPSPLKSCSFSINHEFLMQMYSKSREMRLCVKHREQSTSELESVEVAKKVCAALRSTPLISSEFRGPISKCRVFYSK